MEPIIEECLREGCDWYMTVEYLRGEKMYRTTINDSMPASHSSMEESVVYSNKIFRDHFYTCQYDLPEEC